MGSVPGDHMFNAPTYLSGLQVRIRAKLHHKRPVGERETGGSLCNDMVVSFLLPALAGYPVLVCGPDALTIPPTPGRCLR